MEVTEESQRIYERVGESAGAQGHWKQVGMLQEATSCVPSGCQPPCPQPCPSFKAELKLGI